MLNASKTRRVPEFQLSASNFAVAAAECNFSHLLFFRRTLLLFMMLMLFVLSFLKVQWHILTRIVFSPTQMLFLLLFWENLSTNWKLYVETTVYFNKKLYAAHRWVHFEQADFFTSFASSHQNFSVSFYFIFWSFSEHERLIELSFIRILYQVESIIVTLLFFPKTVIGERTKMGSNCIELRFWEDCRGFKGSRKSTSWFN